MNGALIKACNKTESVKNTGSDCNESMGPAVMFFAVPPGVSWLDSDLADFATWLQTQIHAAKALRVYPLFGPEIPIRKITNNKESDVIFTADDGTQIFIRYGVLNRMFGTTEGGLCFAQAIQSLTKAGYSIIEVDNATQVMFANNPDGTHRAMKTTFMYAPSPDTADFKTPFFSYFAFSVKPEEYVGNGVIYQCEDSSILDLTGLLDTEITLAAAATTTKLKIGVQTECSGTDLVAKYGATLAATTNFVVTDSTGAVVTISAAAIVSGHIELTGTFTSAAKYTVTGAAASIWLAANIVGFEVVTPLVITIP